MRENSWLSPEGWDSHGGLCCMDLAISKQNKKLTLHPTALVNGDSTDTNKIE